MNQPDDLKYTDRDLADEECAKFQALMPKRIAAGEDLQVYSHMQTCERCQSLIHELEEIANFAKTFFSWEEEPPEGVWNGIQQAIKHEEIKTSDTTESAERVTNGR